MSKSFKTDPDIKEAYSGGIDVEFSMPRIQLASLELTTQQAALDRVALCTSARHFTLQENWDIFVDRISYNEGINGTIIIPCEVDDQLVVFSGSNIPAPWIFSTLSLGILQPMGIIGVASIAHEFLYKYGFLLIQKNEEALEEVEISRTDADKLFRDILISNTGTKFIGWLAYFAVQTGWIFGTKYNGKRFQGIPPVISILILVALLSLVVAIIASGGFGPFAVLVLIAYAAFYIASCVFFAQQKNKTS